MLLFNTDLLLNDPLAFLILFGAVAIALVIGISVHEFSHAAAANLQGDMTATRLGRLTLNPKAHLDPMGSLMLLIAGFGWGRPVPVDVSRLRGGRRGMAFVSAAGPASNVALALLFAAVFRLGWVDEGDISRPALESLDVGAWAAIIAAFAVQLNLVLAAINLLPIPPLDGGGILAGIVPRAGLPLLRKLQMIGPPVLLVVVALTLVTDLNVLGTILGPVTDLSDRLIGQ